MKTIEFSGSDNPAGLVDLVENLPDEFEPGQDYRLLFPAGYLYSCPFPVIAAWAKRVPIGVRLVLDLTQCQESARRLVESVGLIDVVESGYEAPRRVVKVASNVSLQPIVVGRSTDEVLDRVHRMVDEWAGAHDSKAFRTLLSELAENILVHSEAETPGYVHARVHKSAQGAKCEITFADSGIGILNSYLEGTNQEARARIAGGASALQIAIDGLTSSKPQEVSPGGRSHFGFGLFTVKRLIEINRGRMTVISGTEYATLDRYRTEVKRLGRPWRGTIVSVVIDLANPLPLELVYEEEVERLVPSGPPTPATARAALVVNPSESHQALREEPRRFVVRDVSPQLLSREIGLAVRAELATLLADGATVEVDLDGVDDITPSVADECFGKLAVRLGPEKFASRVILRGGTPVLHRLIDFVVATRFNAK